MGAKVEKLTTLMLIRHVSFSHYLWVQLFLEQPPPGSR